MTRRIPVRGVVLLLLACLIALALWIAVRAAVESVRIDAERRADANAVALREALDNQRALARQVERLGGEPVVEPPAPLPPPPGAVVDQQELQEREVQEREQQQPERQQVERQDREIQQREAQDRDPNDLETQDEEVQQEEQQDDEVQDEEIQEPEDQEAEVQEDEVQDEERDDPDPNSALNFTVDDQCDPPAGEFVTDVSASWQRSPGAITLILACTSAAPAPPEAQP